MIAKRRNGLNVRNIGKSSRRASLTSLEPHPFTAANMDQRVAHRRKAGAKWLGELLFRKLRRAFQRALIGPIVIVEQLANFFRCHTFPAL